MINLLQEKLEAAENLRNYTKQILLLSTKKDFKEINSMIENRTKYKEIIDSVDEKIKKLKCDEDFCEDSVIVKNLKDDIRKSINLTIDMDKKIRKNINDELKNTKEKLNQPEKSTKLNLKV